MAGLSQVFRQLNMNCGCSLGGLLADCSVNNQPDKGTNQTPFSVSRPLYELGSLVPLHVAGHEDAPTVAEQYELDTAPLGRGSYGEVYGATHRKTGARRAVKTVDKAIVSKTKAGFWRRELDILRRLDHPNIVRLYEAFEDSGAVYLVLELCGGGDLLERVAAPTETVPEKEAALLLLQILGGIQHLHLHGIVHRDVKPENFLFTRREPEREPLPPLVAPMKLIDFGLSRRLSFATGVLMTPKIGTAEYMAPEAVCGYVDEGQADRADMWSVGVVIHTMLTGHFPSPRLAKEPPDEYLSTPYWQRFSSPAKHLLSRLLHFDPQHRITATAALRHPWLAPMSTGEDSILCDGIPEAIFTFASFPGLRRLVLVAAAREVDDRDILTVRKLFVRLELECEGVLTRPALEGAARLRGGVGAVAGELLRAFEKVDTDGSGTIDWTELIAVALCKTGAPVRAASTGSDGDSTYEGTTASGADEGAADEGEEACWRAFELLNHGNGGVSCEAPGAASFSGGFMGDRKTARHWYLM